MTCKDCLHYEVCYAWARQNLPMFLLKPCDHFKDRSKWVEQKQGRWEDGFCSNCKEEAMSTRWDEPIYDYDWEENLRYSHTETHTEYHLTDYCPNCGALMTEGDTE